MKHLRCVLLGFLIVTQLHAQESPGRDTVSTDTIAPDRIIADTTATDTLAAPETVIMDTIKTNPIVINALAPDKIIIDPVITDTLSEARSMAYGKNFETADRLLTKYNKDHTDIHALRLHAQILYWMKAFDRSTNVYEHAIRLFPQPSSLHLDYARVLYQSSKLPETRRMLKLYRQYDSSNVEAEVMYAYLNLWNGKTGVAKKKAEWLLQKYPGNAEATDILNQVGNYTTPYLRTGTEFLSDDQPLKAHVHYVETGVYKSRLFAPSAQAFIYQFRAENDPFHSALLQLSNTFQPAITNKIKVKAGIFRQNGTETGLTGGAEISQRVGKRFLLQAGMERRPYQYTISSIQKVVMEDLSSFSINYNRNDKWLGKAAYELFQYDDDNKIHTAYLWLLAPVVSRPRFAFSVGYAFRYADAANSNFVAKESLSQLIATPPYDGVAGVYNPYFTPENQKIHSALASIKIVPAKKLAFISRVNIGVNATADNPYLWLDERNSQFFVDRDHFNMKFKPANWTSELRVAASERCTIAANYIYDQLLFYKSHRGSLELKYLFIR
jgi:hypothetical protein